MTFKHILLTTDLSSEAVRPIETITELAKASGAKVTILHVVPDLQVIPHGAPTAPLQSSPEVPREMEKATRELEAQRAALGDGFEVETAVTSHEDVAEGIARYAAQHDVDLIALSTHGRTGFRHLLIGSVAEAVLRHSPVPVLSFPRPTKKQ
jgi:nucleotide-binding universal stress UspA family protein